MKQFNGILEENKKIKGAKEVIFEEYINEILFDKYYH